MKKAAIAVVLGVWLLFTPKIGKAQSAENDNVQLMAIQQTEKARAEADKARAEAAKAGAEAEKARMEAEKALAEKAKVDEALKDIGEWPLVGFGLLFGYFFFYGIRHGPRTQEAFKAFLGLLGVSGTATVLSLIGNDPRLMAKLLRPFAEGCFFGFLSYLALAIVLAYGYACGQGCRKHMADYLSRTLLGEDWSDRQGPQPGSL